MRPYIFVLCLLLVGCGAPPPDTASDEPSAATGAPPIQTSQESYEAVQAGDALDVSVPYTYENLSGQAVYVNRCRTPDSPSLQKQVEGEWVTVYTPPRLMCLEAPVVIEAGARYDDVFEMRASLDPDTYPNLQVDRVPGTYRLVWDVYSHHEPDQPATNLLPVEQRVSNTFELTE